MHSSRSSHSGQSLRLPDRPSLEQLRNQAKDLLRAWRAGDAAAVQRVRAEKPQASEPRLADAQFVLAREYGFASWPALVDHVRASGPLERGGNPRPVIKELAHLERLAGDFAAAYQGDSDALARLNERFPGRKTLDDLRRMVQERGRAQSAGGLQPAEPFTVTDARLLIARHMGFATWEELASSVTEPAADPRTAPHGLSTRPPFYRIDWKISTLQPRQPLSDDDWALIIDVIREHGITRVDAGGQMTDRALERLSHLRHVTSLHLDGSKRVTDDGLRHLARMPQLEDLELNGAQITNRGLDVLRELRALRRFELCWARAISDAGMEHLAGCDRIERVNLLGSETGDGALRTLRGKQHLRHIKTGRLVTDAGLALLHDFPVFKTWQGGELRYDLMTFGDAEPNFLMLDGPFTDAGLAQIAGLEGVFGLGFFWHVSQLTPNGLGLLSALPHLGALGCDGRLCDDTAMRHIAQLPGLRMLMAQGTVATDQGFAALSRSQTLECLWGRECPNLQGAGFAALTNLPALRGLAVSCKRVDAASLAALPRFPALTWLLPMDVSDEGFRHVGQCAQLEKLTCMYCRDTGDRATEHISGLPRLRHYYAGQTGITDRSLELLAGIASLEDITLSGCAGITNEGLRHLIGLPRLTNLTVDAGAHVTRAVLAMFPAHVQVILWT